MVFGKQKIRQDSSPETPIEQEIARRLGETDDFSDFFSREVYSTAKALPRCIDLARELRIGSKADAQPIFGTAQDFGKLPSSQQWPRRFEKLLFCARHRNPPPRFRNLGDKVAIIWH